MTASVRGALVLGASLGAAGLVACGGTDVQLGPTGKAEQQLRCPMAPHANMCNLQLSGTPAERATQLTLVEDVAEFWGEAEDAVVKIDGACTAMAHEIGIADLPVGVPALDHAQAACRVVAEMIAQSGPFHRIAQSAAVSCGTTPRPSCGGAVSLPPKRYCDPSPIQIDRSNAVTPSVAAVLELHVPTLLSAQDDLASISELVAPMTFPTQSDSVPQDCVQPVAEGVGSGAHDVSVSNGIIDGLLAAIDGLGVPLR